MLDRLQAVEDEFVSLESSLSDPDIVSDQARLRDVTRRYKDLTPVVDCIRRYRGRTADLDTARSGFLLTFDDGFADLWTHVLDALAAAGVGELALYDTRAASAESLGRRLREHYPALVVRTGSNDPDGFDVVVNATPVGMKDDDPLPFDVSRIAPSCFVGEVVMKSEFTPLLRAALDKGCEVQVGTDMLFEQIPPVQSWGRQFILNPFADRKQGGTPVRVVADQDNTVVSVNGSVVATLQAGAVYQYNYWEAPFNYTGAIYGVWSTVVASDGGARVTEFT